MQRHRRQKRTILSGLPRPKIRPNRRCSLVGETQQKSPHFVGVFPIFRPFCPSKWEKSPNRSLSGGTGRARGRNQHQPSRGITRSILTAPLAWSMRRRNQHQPSRGITSEAMQPPPLHHCRSRNQHQPSRGITSRIHRHAAHCRRVPESTSTQSRDYKLSLPSWSNTAIFRRNQHQPSRGITSG